MRRNFEGSEEYDEVKFWMKLEIEEKMPNEEDEPSQKRSRKMALVKIASMVKMWEDCVGSLDLGPKEILWKKR